MSEENDEPIEISAILEGALFSSESPLSAEALAKFFPKEERPALGEIRQKLKELQEHYALRGVVLIEVASGFRFQVSENVAPLVGLAREDKPTKYSRALMETLALVAYRQPITRAEIEEIRGVAVSSHIVRTLIEHDWIRVVGHREVPGRPSLLATTKGFLDYFGLKNLNQLPPLAELKDLDSVGDKIEFEQQSKLCIFPPKTLFLAQKAQQMGPFIPDDFSPEPSRSIEDFSEIVVTQNNNDPSPLENTPNERNEQ